MENKIIKSQIDIICTYMRTCKQYPKYNRAGRTTELSKLIAPKMENMQTKPVGEYLIIALIAQ